MALRAIKDFPKAAPSTEDLILIEQQGGGRSTPLSELPVSTPVSTRIAGEVNTLNSRIDNIMASSGDDISEIVDARQGSDGTNYASLKARLDAEHSELKGDLDELKSPTANNIIAFKKLENKVLDCGLQISTNGKGTYVASGTVSDWNGNRNDRHTPLSDNFKLEAGTYTLSITTDSTLPIRPFIISKSNVDISYVASPDKSATFTLDSYTEVYLGFMSQMNGVYDNEEYKIQLEKGNIATKWNPPYIVVDSVARLEIEKNSDAILANSLLIEKNTTSIQNIESIFGVGKSDVSLNEDWENGRYTSDGIEQENTSYIRTGFLKPIKPCTVTMIAKNNAVVRARICTKNGNTYSVIRNKATTSSETETSFYVNKDEFVRFEVLCPSVVQPSEHENYVSLSYSFESIYDEFNRRFDSFGYSTNDLVERTFMPYKFKPQAHRGKWGSDIDAQNTIGAFEEAGKMSVVYGIETDVQQTSDGVFVCYHDSDLSSLTNGSGSISSHTYEEIQTYLYKNGTLDRKICSIADYLKVCRKYGKIPYIELKILENSTNNTSVSIRNLLELIKAYGFENRCVFTSSNLSYITELRKQTNKYIAEFMLLSTDTSTPQQVIDKIKGLSNIVVRIYSSRVTEETVNAYHSSGYLVDAQGMTTFDQTIYDNMVACGIEGCTCNDWSALETN